MARFPWHGYLFVAGLLVVLVYVLRRGGAPERAVAIGFVAAAALGPVVQGRSFAGVLPGVLVTDLALMMLLGWLALASARFWPMLMASAQAAQLLAHFARWAGPDILPYAYYYLLISLSYPMLALLAVATWRHRRRLVRYGIDPAWPRDLPSAYRAGKSLDEKPTP